MPSLFSKKGAYFDFIKSHVENMAYFTKQTGQEIFYYPIDVVNTLTIVDDLYGEKVTVQHKLQNPYKLVYGYVLPQPSFEDRVFGVENVYDTQVSIFKKLLDDEEISPVNGDVLKIDDYIYEVTSIDRKYFGPFPDEIVSYLLSLRRTEKIDYI